MKILEKIFISKSSDAIYLKVTLKNLLRSQNQESSFLIICAMELATNLYKYAGFGEILILQSQEKIFLASIDNGDGIINTALATTKGYSTNISSLGLGLHVLNSHDEYNFHLFSLHKSKSKRHGTVALLLPIELEDSFAFFSVALDSRGYNGDYFHKRFNNFLFGDASGHGKKAQLTADFVKELFTKQPSHLTQVENFFHQVHNDLLKKEYRGTVMSVIVKENENYKLWGVGDLNILSIQNHEIQKFSFKNGVIGATIGNIDFKMFKREKDKLYILTSDGIECGLIDNNFAKFIDIKMPPLLVALILYNFFGTHRDDNSILVLKG